MKPVIRILLLVSFAFSTLSFAQKKEVQIPRSEAGDKGKYYLMSQSRKGNIVSTLHKRVGVDATGYTRSEINCQTMKMRVIGYSEISAQAIKREPTKWFDLVPGSSKSDLAHFVCKPNKEKDSSLLYRMTAGKSDPNAQRTDSDGSAAGGIISALICAGMVYGLLTWRRKSKDQKEQGYVSNVLAQGWEVGDAIIQPNWTERDWTGFKNEAVALDRTNQVFGIVKATPYAKRIDIRFNDIIKSEVVVDSETIMQTQTNRGSQVVGAVVGGVLAGGVGAIIGGVTGSKTHKGKDKIKSVELKVLTAGGIVNIPFAAANLKLATKWHDLLTIVMHTFDAKSSDVSTHLS